MAFRYSFGGDTFLFVEVSEEGMSLEAFFLAMAICKKLREMQVEGITEICPANASYMIAFNPDILPHTKALKILQDLEKEVVGAQTTIQTRLIEMPVFYNDPYTHECLMGFRNNHQCREPGSTLDPNMTDIEYARQTNGYASVAEFIEAHANSPWFVSMIGFVAGLPWLYQLVERKKQIEVPKYPIARIDTPALTIGHGGCFGCIYAVRGGGGYQMMGITPAPVWDPAQRLPYFKESMVFLNPGDIIKFSPCTEAEYHSYVKQVEEGTFDLKICQTPFSLQEWQADPTGYNQKILKVLA
ncbi:allophanate hydrolase subunit 1 [Helicobacter sp. NHP21005]|uniref:5-oxoprolinase subunit B family protein n=1 Tax=Helicobacter felistomachi TaxID=3040201 RepID=UPI0025737579|nr:carboxyltransferase domain-containing protein [Helicobacter sp. NHP21005]BEG57543.1 allophanate hydrolase subunit 1 [Helicobacter sp. NHP21005]